MDAQQLQQINKYIGLIFRRKYLIVSCLLVALLIGLGKYITTPKVYQASSLLIYQRQRVNPTKMSPDDLRTATREMVGTLTQQVTSRTNLENMIKQFNLYEGMRQKLPMEDVVVNMRDNAIDIKQKKGDIFQVNHKGSSPKKVMLVTNALASKFIEENLRFREEMATETSAYVKDELEMAKNSLDEKEKVMRDFKLKYYNQMPNRFQVNMTRLTALQNQIQKKQDSVHDLERTKVLIQEQISLRNDFLAQIAAQNRAVAEATDEISGITTNLGPFAAKNLPELEELQRAQDRLAGLRIRYTDEHPEVKRTKKLIRLLELKAAQAGSLITSEPVPTPTAGGKESAIPAAPRVQDIQLNELTKQLRELEYNIARIKEDETEIRAQIGKTKTWLESAPIREAEWTAMNRGYEQLQKHYTDLVARSINAESAETLERRQKGSQFKIVDPAHFPEKPFHPDFLKIILLAAALGLGAGVGLSFALEMTDDSFREAGQIEADVDLPVICSIPLVLTPRESIRSKATATLWTVGLIASTSAIVAGMVYLWLRGVIII